MGTMLEKTRAEASDLYGPDYYASHCGPVPYERNDFWLQFFGRVADELVRSFAPRRLFDAGCAIGLLVECLWERGVEAHGRDISPWAIDQVRADVRPWCHVGSIAEPITGSYDLVTCIEVLEHIPEEEALAAIQVMAAAAPRILFSSTPTDLNEPTHVNVRPSIYWLTLWAEAGFAPSITHDAGYLAPHAYVLERAEGGRSPRDLIAFADRIRHRIALSQLGNDRAGLQRELVAERSDRQRWLEEAQRRQSDVEAKLALAEAQSATTRAALQAEIESIRRQHSALQGDMHGAEAALRAAKSETRLTALKLRDAETQILAETRARHDAEQETRAARTEGASAIAQAQRETVAWQGEADAARHAARLAQAERQAVVSSTTWRAAHKLHRCLRLVPRPLRRAMGRSMKLMWWTITLRLTTRLRTDVERARRVAASPYFDQDWYLRSNPDVAAGAISPAIHYGRFGGAEGRDPGPRFSIRQYLNRHPEGASFPGGAFVHALTHGRTADGEVSPVTPAPSLPAPAASEADPAKHQTPPDDAYAIVASRFVDLSPLPIYPVPGNQRRLTLVTDSIGGGSLYGGVGTALIMAALAAERIGCALRLVTRTEPADTTPIAGLLSANGVDWTGNIETIYAPRDASGNGHDVPMSDGDLFLTTSWWTTWATSQSVEKKRMAYIVQEDERMFYPLGDDHLRCSEVLATPDLLCVVNSNLLLEHFQNHGLMKDATAFEPSFPADLYYADTEAVRAAGEKRKFFFYARPHNSRNLYWRGLEVVACAIEEGVLDPEEWDFYFAGHGNTSISLPRGVRPIMPGVMTWQKYAEFVRGMDLGLSLMHTPHPSYPPLDLAASGSVVVTTRFGVKRDLSRYSNNILCCDSDLPSLVAALREAAILSENRELRSKQWDSSGLQRNWSVSMAPALDRIVNWARA